VSSSKPNPLTLVHDALWELVAKQPIFADLVKPGNRIQFNDPRVRDPIKASATTADLPEVLLTSEGLSPVRLCRTSSTSSIIKQWGWVITTGDYRLNEFLLPIEWAIIACMMDWKRVLTALRWPPNTSSSYEHFVKRTDVVGTQHGESDARRNRGIAGFSSIMTIEVEMHFRTLDIQNLLTQE
jgi:hypothetical protein